MTEILATNDERQANSDNNLKHMFIIIKYRYLDDILPYPRTTFRRVSMVSRDRIRVRVGVGIRLTVK